MYLQLNPNLEPSPFINFPRPLSDSILKFSRIDRVEHHFIYSCSRIRRDDLQLLLELADFWKNPDVFRLFLDFQTTTFCDCHEFLYCC